MSLNFNDTIPTLSYINNNTKLRFHTDRVDGYSHPISVALLMHLGKNLSNGTTSGIPINVYYSACDNGTWVTLCKGNINNLNGVTRDINSIIKHIETESVIGINELCYGIKEIIFSDSLFSISPSGDFSYSIEYSVK